MTAPHTTQSVARQSATRPRTVAILESSAQMGGIQHTTLALAARLDRSAWTPILICPEEGDLTRACRDAGVEVRVLPIFPMWSTSVWLGDETKVPNPFAWMWNAATILATSRRLAKTLAALQPDLVLTKGLLCHFYGGIAARTAGIPCLWYVQDHVSERFGGVYRRVFGWMARHVPTAVSAIGPQIVRQLPASVRDRARVVYNAIDSSKFRLRSGAVQARARLGIDPDAIVIGNAARLTPWKGQHHLLEAFAGVVRELPHARLLLVGGSLFGDCDYESRLRRRADQPDLAGRVILAGHRLDMREMFSAMDVFAYTSVEKDICPLSLLEAMAAGLPIAAFDIEGVREAILDQREGLLIPVGDADALAPALLRLIQTRELRQRLGESARTRVERQFSLDRHVSRMQEVFDEVLTPQFAHHGSAKP